MEPRHVLVTDSKFILPENERTLESHGFVVDRLPRHNPTDTEVAAALRGKSGYVVGGNEVVTDRVLEEADILEAIVYPGTSANCRAFVPSFDTATQRGIAIASAPGGDSASTAEYAVTLILAMMRRLYEVGQHSKSPTRTTPSLSESRVGLIGLGNVGTNVALMLRALGVQNISYYTRSRKIALEAALRLQYKTRDELLISSDIVSIHTPIPAGEVIDASGLRLMPDGGLIVNVSYPEAVDGRALLDELTVGRLRAAFDGPPSGALSEARQLSPGQFFWSDECVGYNTFSTLRVASAMITDTLINLLETGEDRFLLNSEYRLSSQGIPAPQAGVDPRGQVK